LRYALTILLLLGLMQTKAQTTGGEAPADSLEVLLKADGGATDVLEAEISPDHALAVDTAAVKAVSDSLSRSVMADSLSRVVVDERELYDKKAFWKPDPIRAMWLGLVVPGLGQIYNRKYWKLPIIYGGFLGCIYALTWNAQMLADYNQAYLDIMDSNPNTKSYEKMLPIGYDITGKEDRFKEIFKNRKNTYRRYRDLSIFVMLAIYALSVVDAYIDAELSTFDISRDLTLRVVPATINSRLLEGNRWSSSHGIGCQLEF